MEVVVDRTVAGLEGDIDLAVVDTVLAVDMAVEVRLRAINQSSVIRNFAVILKFHTYNPAAGADLGEVRNHLGEEDSMTFV